jgi:alanine dehydrogenase
VALSPAAVATLAADGHDVRVERGAGAAIGHGDELYASAGATLSDAREAWAGDLIVKVKELQPAELEHLPRDRVIFGFHQLPSEPGRTRELASRGATAIAYEAVRDAQGRFPLLAPMSRISGRLALEAARRHLGRMPRRVLVLGAGNAGLAAARAALEGGAQVTVLTRTPSSRDASVATLGAAIEAGLATPQAIDAHARAADLVVGAAFVRAEPTPKLLPRSLVARMQRGAMIVDISIDGGGVAETSRVTTHADPVYVEEGVIHYCVANMPAAQPDAAAAALSEAVLPFVREIASLGVEGALRADAALRAGVLVWRGGVVHPGIAAEANLPYTLLP